MPLYDKSFILVVPTGNDPEFSQLWVVPLYLKLKNLNFVADLCVFYFTFLKVEPPTLKSWDSSFTEILLNFARSFNGSSYRNISYVC